MIEDYLNVAVATWSAIGIVLLIGEALGAAGFLIGAAISAFGMALAVWLFPDISVLSQVVIYVGVALVSTFVYVKVFRKIPLPLTSTLQSRSEQLLGHQFVLDSALAEGEETQIMLGDTRWRVVADEALGEGEKVEVAATETMKLRLRRFESTA